MDKRLVALKLVLNSLDVSSGVSTVQDRKRIQKAIYLAQVAGVSLSYKFGWYLMGPYSPVLTKDYFALNEAVESGEDEYSKYKLSEAQQKHLGTVTSVASLPQEIELESEDWLELLASLHFLMDVRGLSFEDAETMLKKDKQHVVGYASEAWLTLQEANLLRRNKAESVH